MSRSKNVARYSPIFYDLVETAYTCSEEHPFIWPTTSEKAAKAFMHDIYGFRAALESAYANGKEHLQDILSKAAALRVKKIGSTLHIYNPYQSTNYLILQKALQLGQANIEPVIFPELPPSEPPEPKLKLTNEPKFAQLDTSDYYSKFIHREAAPTSPASPPESPPTAPDAPIRPFRKPAAPEPARTGNRGAGNETGGALSSENLPPKPTPDKTP